MGRRQALPATSAKRARWSSRTLSAALVPPLPLEDQEKETIAAIVVMGPVEGLTDQSWPSQSGSEEVSNAPKDGRTNSVVVGLAK